LHSTATTQTEISRQDFDCFNFDRQLGILPTTKRPHKNTDRTTIVPTSKGDRSPMANSEKHSTIAIITAIPTEFQRIQSTLVSSRGAPVEIRLLNRDILHWSSSPFPVYLARCGVGKANAASMATALILLYKVDCILNCGVGGGFATSQNVGDVAIATSFVYTDVDVCNLGFQPGQLLDEPPAFPASDRLLEFARGIVSDFGVSVHFGIFGTGDSFIRREKPEPVEWIQANLPNVICVDMEGAAIAHVCDKMGVPLFAMRVLSDIACRPKGTEDYIFSLDAGSVLAANCIGKMLDAIASNM
jgi:5'-methylthioadenosine/S-adenosylhomocysteine nucleosidase